MSAEKMQFPCGASMLIDLPQGSPVGRGTDRMFSVWQGWHDDRCECNAEDESESES